MVKLNNKKFNWYALTAIATFFVAGVAIFPVYREWKVKRKITQIIRVQIYKEVYKLKNYYDNKYLCSEDNFPYQRSAAGSLPFLFFDR